MDLTDNPELKLLKARPACEAALRERARVEHELKMAKMENARLRTAVALLRRRPGDLPILGHATWHLYRSVVPR